MAKDINIQDLINKINKFREERDWRKFHNPKDLSISISLVASELLELFQWKSSEEAVENNLDRMKDEIADIFIYLLMLSDDLGLDLFSAVTEKMNKNNGKYPKELCKGKRDKYTAYLEWKLNIKFHYYIACLKTVGLTMGWFDGYWSLVRRTKCE